MKIFRHILPYAAIVAVCLVCYGNVSKYDFNLDDAYILNYLPPPETSVWKVLTQPFGPADFRPLSLLSFAIEQKITGMIDPHTAHSINLFLFIMLCLLIFQTLRSLPIANSMLLALCASLLFAAHPVHSGVVCSIKSRDTILSLLLAMGTIWLVMRAESRKQPYYYGLAMLTFLAALYTKLDSMVLVFILPLLLFCFYKAPVKKVIGIYFILLLGILLLRYLPVNMFILNDEQLRQSVSFVENPLTAKPGLANSISQSLQSLYTYLKFMVVPANYHFYFGYDMLPLYPLFSKHSIFFLLVHIFLLSLAALQYKTRPILSFSILLFYFSLSYCSNLITPVAGIVADRYAFYASLGFCLFAAVLLQMLADRLAQGKPAAKKITLVAAICLTLIYAGFTMHRNSAWENIYTLLETDLPHLQHSFEANRIAASNYFKAAAETSDIPNKQQYTERGLQCALQANAIYPDNPYILESIGQAYFNLGQPAPAAGILYEAIRRFDTLTVSPEVLGDILYLSGNKFDSAAWYYQLALTRHTPRQVVSMKYLRALTRQGQYAEAGRYSDSLLKNDPDNYFAYQCRAFLKLQQGDSLDGLRTYARSFEFGYRNPSDARDIQQKLLRLSDTVAARKLDPYLEP